MLSDQNRLYKKQTTLILFTYIHILNSQNSYIELMDVYLCGVNKKTWFEKIHTKFRIKGRDCTLISYSWVVGTRFLCYSLYILHFWNEFKFKKKNKYYVKDCIPWEGEWHGQIAVWKAPFSPDAEEFLPECRLGQGKPDYQRLLELVKRDLMKDFPSGPVVKIHLEMQVMHRFRELRSHMPQSN